jgi:peptidoglycan/xylan/chitin deacetylase (PgdA/CDA1 family)
MTRLPGPPTLADWRDLAVELDRWALAERQASFWWRDDDAVSWTPALEQLLARAAGLPLALAVIPAEAAPDLAARLAPFPAVRVLQHGWRHRNHAPAGEKKAELGSHRPAVLRLQELGEGKRRLAALFGTRALPVLVPPWNRIAEDLPPLLSGIGIRGLSTVLPRAGVQAAPGLTRVNVHVDLVDWPSGHGFIGEGPALGAILGHLIARRTGRVDAAEPTGLLTHHLVQDADTGRFLDRFLDVARSHGAARFPAISEIFSPS